jgi:hypothetical protein
MPPPPMKGGQSGNERYSPSPILERAISGVPGVLCRAAEPHDQDADAEIRSTHERFLEAAGEFEGRLRLHFAHYNFCRSFQ